MKFILFLILFYNSNTFASSLCEDLQTNVTESNSLLKDLIMLKLRPELFAKVNENIKGGSTMYMDQNKRNIIFSFMPHQYNASQEFEYQSFLNKKEKLIKEYQDYIKILKSQSKPRCIQYVFQSQKKRRACTLFETIEMALKRCQKYDTRSLSFQKLFQALQEEEKRMNHVKLYLEAVKAKEYIRDAKLQLDWEYIASTTLNEVHEILNSSNIGHVVFINHASKSGSLIDSNGSDIRSKTFLTHFSSSLESISFYSCYADNIPKKYNLKNKFKKLKLYPFVFTPPKNTFFNQVGLTPLSGITSFLENLEEKILSINSNYVPIPEKKLCRVHLPEIQIKSGEIEVSLNSNFLTTISAQNPVNQLDIPCHYFGKKNQLYLTQIQRGTIIQGQFSKNIDIDSENRDFFFTKFQRNETKEVFYSQKYQFSLRSYK